MKLEPPAYLADTCRKLSLSYNGLAGADTSRACHVFTCSLPPLAGASLDVPEGATAGELEDAYNSKVAEFESRERLNAQAPKLLVACRWMIDALDGENRVAIWRELLKQPGAVEWCKNMELAAIRATNK